MIDDIDNFIAHCRFFVPAPGLARAIAKENQELVIHSLRAPSDEEELDQENDEEEDAETPVSPNESSGIVQGKPSSYETYHLQRIVAERLYHFLTSMAESPHARNGGRFPLREVIPGGMAAMLGVPAQSAALNMLTNRFRSWLKSEHDGGYTGPSWKASLDDDDNLLLEVFVPEEIQQESIMENRNACTVQDQERMS